MSVYHPAMSMYTSGQVTVKDEAKGCLWLVISLKVVEHGLSGLLNPLQFVFFLLGRVKRQLLIS